MPARVALNLRESGAVFPCKWCSVAEIYIYYIRDYDFEEYREWICNTREAISRDDLIEEILIQMGSVPNVEE